MIYTVQKTGRHLFLLLLALSSWCTAVTQVSIAAHNTTYTTNLNGWNGTLPNGFTRSSNNNYVGTATATTGGVYAIPGSGFGYRPSSNASATTCSLTATFQNNTTSAITSLDISYQAFRITSAAARTPNWTVTSTLGNVSALNWTFDDSGVAETLTTTIAVNIPAGGTFTLTFASDRGAGSQSSPLIGLNNIQVKSNLAPTCPYPTNLAENNVTHEFAQFDWDVQGNDGYEYVLALAEATPVGAGTAVAENFWSTDELMPATNYFFYVRTNCGNGNFSSWTMVNFTTAPEPCPTPNGLIALNPTHQSAEMSWDAMPGNSFEYVLDELSTDPAGAGMPIAANDYEATGLSPLTMYRFHLRTVCGNGTFSAWITTGFTTHITPCPAASGITAEAITATAAQLSWDAQTGATFEYVLDETNADPTEAGTSTTDTTYAATDLAPLTEYFFHIRTNCGSENVSPWTTISFTTPVTPCPIASHLAATGTTYESADISWDEVGSNTFEYVLDNLPVDPTHAGTAIATTSYAATDLQPATTYYFHIRTDCGNGNFSPWRTVSFTTGILPCAAPTGLSGTFVSDVFATLAWDAQTGIEGFEYVRDHSAANPVGAGTPVSTNSVDLSGLTAATTYYTHIRTNCGNGNFSDWATISFMTTETPIPPCIIPTGFNGHTTSNTATITWNAQTGIAGYGYVVSQSPAEPIGAGSPVAVSYLDLTGLPYSTNYYLHVRTICANGNFSEWVSFPFTTTSPLGLEEVTQLAFNAYPNPAKTQVNILAPVQEGTITLVNANGQALRSIELKTTVSMDLSGIAGGLYMLIYEKDGIASTRKLVIE